MRFPEEDAPFRLRDVVRQVLGSSTLADPGLLADEVWRRIAAEDRDAALRQSLRLFVRQVVSEDRMLSTPPTASTNGQSVKGAAIRDAWQRGLLTRVFTGVDWKLMRDMTRDDLLGAAGVCRRKSEENAGKARYYESLVRALAEGEKDRLGDLPATVLAPLLGRAA